MSAHLGVGVIIGFIGFVAIFMQSQHYAYLLESQGEVEPDPESLEYQIKYEQDVTADYAALKKDVAELKSNVSTLMLKAGFKV